MSLLFGNLTQQFVSFGSAEVAYSMDPNNATVVQQLQAAAADFRSSSAVDASYLVYIGTSPFLPSIYILIPGKESDPLPAHFATWSFGPTLAK